MTRRWTLRGGDSEIAILVITGAAERLDALALEVSTLGYYTFVATPAAVEALVAVTRFDLVVVVGDVSPTERELVAAVRPRIEPARLTLSADDDWPITDRIRARLAH